MATIPESKLKELMLYFSNFWREVYERRGRTYWLNLKRQLVSETLTNKAIYSATEKNFRHFLHNLERFKTTGSWRIPIYSGGIAPEAPLPEFLEGALRDYGWHQLRDLVVLATLEAAEDGSE